MDRNTNLSVPKIAEGIRITKIALNDIAEYLAEKEVPFHVVVMPLRDHIVYNVIDDEAISESHDLKGLASNIEAIEADFAAFGTDRIRRDPTDWRAHHGSQSGASLHVAKA